MTTLSILVEAAKLIEYDEDIYKNRRKSLPLVANEPLRRSTKQVYPVQCQSPKKTGYRHNVTEDIRRGNRESHNILEKNRRADMKNYFQKLKANLPKLRDMVKASNVSILTVAVNHIQELTEADRNFQIEKAVLRKCQSNLEDRIKVLKEDIRRQHFCAQLFVQVQEEMGRVQESSSPKMASVEVQANENDIKAEMPSDGVKAEMPSDGGSNVERSPQRTSASDLRNDFSHNLQSPTERLPLPTPLNSRSPLATSPPGRPGCEDSVASLAYLSNGDTTTPCTESVGVQCKIPKHNGKSVSRRKRKLVRENDDSDSDSDLKIIVDDE